MKTEPHNFITNILEYSWKRNLFLAVNTVIGLYSATSDRLFVQSLCNDLSDVEN